MFEDTKGYQKPSIEEGWTKIWPKEKRKKTPMIY